jgi:hypothetical protein
MPWWGWALVGWAVIATVAALWLAAAAGIARTRERAARRHQYATVEPPTQGESVRRLGRHRDGASRARR